jgi:hydroxyacylglutathione hydrolase
MSVVPIPAFFDNYIWAIIDDNEAGVFDCIDPGESAPVIRFADENKLRLRTILLTHHHNDHIGGVEQLLSQYPSCAIYGPIDPRIPYVTKRVIHDQMIQIGQHSFKVLFNPGHTSTHISYYEPLHHWLFCGDTLFSAGCGRVFDGTIAQLHQSLQMFKTLAPETKIFCAHEYTQQNLKFALTVEPENTYLLEYAKQINQQPTVCSLPSNLSQELLINPFLRTDIPEVQHYALKHGAASSTSLDVFTVLRTQKNNTILV